MRLQRRRTTARSRNSTSSSWISRIHKIKQKTQVLLYPPRSCGLLFRSERRNHYVDLETRSNLLPVSEDGHGRANGKAGLRRDGQRKRQRASRRDGRRRRR